MATDRAVLFVDGNNWYHGLRAIGVTNLLELNYATISKKLAGPRMWAETRYYIGRVQQTPLGAQAYADQRRFLARLQRSDSRISTPRPAGASNCREPSGHGATTISPWPDHENRSEGLS